MRYTHFKIIGVLTLLCMIGALISSNQSLNRTSSTDMNRVSSSEAGFIDSRTAKLVDELLMQSPGFSIDQLMELAGLSVASGVDSFVRTLNTENDQILVLCGPGNNGGGSLLITLLISHYDSHF